MESVGNFNLTTIILLSRNQMIIFKADNFKTHVKNNILLNFNNYLKLR